MQKLILAATLLLLALSAHAQLPPMCLPNQPPPDLCANACVYCDINGYVGTTVGYTGSHSIACGGIYLDNDQWLGFVAGDTMADFTVTNIACVKGDGLQIAIYEHTCINDDNPIDCDAGQQGGEYVPVEMDNVPLVPGTVYFLLIDGWASDKCTFQITVDPPAAVIANPLGATIGPIEGPDTICPGAIVTYSVPHVTNAGAYTWSVPAGWLINGLASPQLINATDGGRSVKIRVGANSGQVCVQAANSCFPIGPNTCKSITVAPLPTTILAPAYVCNEDKPYQLPWGQLVSNSGVYQRTLHSYVGCDSTVRQQVIIQPPLATTLPATTICSGDHFNVCGVPYSNAGSYSLTCQTAQGCDSTVHFSLSTLAPIAKINGGNTLTCSTTSTLLTASASPAGTLFQWNNSAGQDLGDSTHLIVTTPDSYILTATLQGGGIQCVKTDTIFIASNTISPGVSSSGGTLNCTVHSLELQTISNANAPTWIWSGPGSFSATTPNPIASLAGTYFVTVTDGLNGCTASATTTVQIDTILPVVTAFGAILTCSDTAAQITANGLPASVTYQWAGQNSFSSAFQSPVISTAGLYTVTATNTINTCTAVAIAEVSLNDIPPGASTIATGIISCATPSIQMMGEPWLSGNSFLWTGPNSFSSADQNPFATLAGTYTLMVTGANGCTSESSILVTGDTIAPNIAAAGGSVNCAVPAIAILGNSTTIGATFTWDGPNGFLSMFQNPVATDTGVYILTVTGPNTCTASASATLTGDFELPDISATTDTITCTHPSVPVTGSSLTLGTSFEWNGPGSFFSAINPVSVTIGGVYVLTATAPNGCTAQTSVTVPVDIAEPGATALSDTLTCRFPAIVLAGGANITNVQWNWTGPGNFMSSQQQPTIQVPGLYVLEVTNLQNGCLSSATITVEVDQVAPLATSNTGILTCTLDTMILNGQSDMPSAFTWTGPNGFVFTGAQPMVAAPGDYTLVAQAIGNGCSDTIVVTVAQDITAPDAGALGGTLDCNTAQISLTGISATGGAAFLWTGPQNFSAALQNPVTSVPGQYLLTVTGPNGCQTTASAIIIGDFELPDISATTDTITCTHPSVPVAGSSLTSGTSFEWNGPGSFFSALNSVSVTVGGLYVLTATAPNGCTAQTSVTVPVDIAEPGATAQSDTLTCRFPAIVLAGGANIANVQWNWTGPGNFMSSQQQPTIQVPGLYVLEVTNLQNGCLSTATTTVEVDQVAPLATSNTGILTCTLDTLILNGQSDMPSAFTWTGPNGFVFTGAQPMVAAPGDYTLMAQAIGNGCSDTIVVSVAQDITAPDASAMGGTLDCNTAQINLSGFSATGGTAFLWTGPQNFSSALQNPVTSLPGQYLLTVTGPNGCQATAQALVLENTDAPVVGLAGSDTLTCALTEVTLVATIGTAGAIGVWSGPNNFIAQTPEITISTPGNYVFTVTALNGCISTPLISVVQNIDVPSLLNTQGGLLNCSIQGINLVTGSMTASSYAWSGPGNFSSSLQTPIVTNPGDYVVTVTDLINGCTSTAVALVTQDISVPDITVQSDILTCYATSVLLNATSTTPAVAFDWSGPNNFDATIEDPATSFPGDYQVTVTGQNGCTATFDYSVDQDISLPDVNATGDTLTCWQPLGEISSYSATPAATYSWSGPGGFGANEASVAVSMDGLYAVVVTGPNGCTSSAQVTVVADQMAPATAAAGGLITCLNSSVILSGMFDHTVVWQWSGPGNFSSNLQQPTVTVPGTYLLTTTATNGCTSTAVALVEDRTQTPNITIPTPDSLDCTATQVILEASVSGSGLYTYQWTTNNGMILMGADSPTPVVTQAGLYTVHITDITNGCTASSEMVVHVNPETPSGAVLQKQNVSCFGEMDGSVKVSTMVGGTPPFEYSLDHQSFTSLDYFPGLEPGTHTLLIKDFNGCEYETSFVIETLDELLIDLGSDTTLHLGQSIEITLDGQINFPDRVVETYITPQDLVLPDTVTPTHSFRYRVTIVDSSGCRAEDSRVIIVDRERWVYIPNIFSPESEDNNLLTIFGGADVQIIKSFLIFDRWGNAIFERRAFQPNDDANGWDGRFNGALMNPAVFVYYAEILFKDGETEVFKGDVTLVR